MIAEKKIKIINRKDDEAGFQEMQDYCKALGYDSYVVEDRVSLKELPIEFKELVKSYGLKFHYFVVSGFHGLRHGKDEMILCGIYDYIEPEKNKEFEIDLKSLFQSDNVLEMYITAARDLNGEEDDGKVYVKVARPSDIVEDVLSSMRNYIWEVIKPVKAEENK